MLQKSFCDAVEEEVDPDDPDPVPMSRVDISWCNVNMCAGAMQNGYQVQEWWPSPDHAPGWQVLLRS